ncbi:unnamed protein product [Cochlearia groenlandica]
MCGATPFIGKAQVASPFYGCAKEEMETGKKEIREMETAYKDKNEIRQEKGNPARKRKSQKTDKTTSSVKAPRLIHSSNYDH